MRFKTLILSSLLFLALLAVTALSVDWTDPSYKADEMFHSGEDEAYVNPVGAPATPQEARELQKNKSALNWTMPSTLTGGGDSARESRESAQSSSESETSTSTETAASEIEISPVQTEAVNVQGNWFFTLNDSVIRDLALTLLQDGSDVYGSGRIKEGNNSMDVSASGAVIGSDMKLNLVSTNPIIQYKLNLTLDQDRASGDFRALCAGCENWIGTAEGQKTG